MQQGARSGSRKPESILRGSGIIAEIKASRIEFVISVPDITTSEGLLRPLAQASSPRLIRICKEDEGVAICGGLLMMIGMGCGSFGWDNRPPPGAKGKRR